MQLKINMGLIDRSFRILVGIALIYIGFINSSFVSSETLRYILGAIGVVNIVSSLAGICPIYLFANINTCHKREAS